jgi:peptidoglycan/xylan/chitin deacetylase (PgdA/CDA1 family)
MIDCIFTLDYEIYGNGYGRLKDLVYEPADRLRKIFDEANAKLVVFVEAAELEMIAAYRSDHYIDAVQRQVQDLYEAGHEIGLHLHPQWYNGQFRNGEWKLHYAEYNLCTLPRERIAELVIRAIAYLRRVVQDDVFTPVSFRAGNWLFQPTATAAAVLAENGIKVDTSVFRGGCQREHGLDYRRTPRDLYFWRFKDDVTRSDPWGILLEMPIHTRVVPFWKMISRRRVGLGGKAPTMRPDMSRWSRLADFCRVMYPLKLDFCRMTWKEATAQIDAALRQDAEMPDAYRPLVAIGHTKDAIDLTMLRDFLQYLREHSIHVSTLVAAHKRCGLFAPTQVVNSDLGTCTRQ